MGDARMSRCITCRDKSAREGAEEVFHQKLIPCPSMNTTVRFAILLLRVCRTIICALILAPVVQATLPYNDGEIFLGVRAGGGEGATTCYLVRVGSATQFTGASGQVSVNLGNIKTDLENTFGAERPATKCRSYAGHPAA